MTVSPGALLARQRSASMRRDPRAAPLHAQRNATSADDSCRYYPVKDAITGCRFPRSCADCLATPGCELTVDGDCTDENPYKTYDIAKNASASSHQQRVSRNVVDLASYPARTTDYCASDDAVCSSCRAEFKTLGQTAKNDVELRNLFCVDEDGCVCTGMCEATEVRQSRVYDNTCGMLAPVFVKPRKIPSYSSTHRDPRAPLTARTLALKGEETCEHDGKLTMQGCPGPRRSADCLKREGCMIFNQECMAFEAMPNAYYLNQTRLDGTSLYYMQFPSVTTPICVVDDPLCTSCPSAVESFSDFGPNSSVFACMGLAGCLCEPFLKYLDELMIASSNSCRAVETGDAVVVNIVTAFSFVLILVLWFAIIMSDGKRRQRVAQVIQEHAVEMLRHMLDRVPMRLDLDLFGWRRYHRQLQYKEQQLLQGQDVSSPVSRPMDLENMLIPSAPDFDIEEESTAPTKADPMALASAPTYRSVGASHISEEEEHGAPSAPDFDF